MSVRSIVPLRRRTAVLALLFATPVLAVAQSSPSPGVPPADAVSGEIRKIDRDPVRLTLRHGEIKSLDMPPMTMVFRVQSADAVARFKVGDKVRFRAEKSGSDFVVTWIEPAP